MTTSVKLIKKSRHPLYPKVPDIAAVQLRYPRFIHAELMTHRVFSRSASSSRAIPVMRLIRDVLYDPAMPVEWGSNQPGMQAGAALTGWRQALVKTAWLAAMYFCVALAWIAAKAGAHKQIVNRIIEPWSHISVIVTATEWENFFDLRCHPAADPTMRALAVAIEREILYTRATQLDAGDWHTPYVDDHDGIIPDVLDASAARCARVSYLNHDNSQPNHAKDLDLAEKLKSAKHMSPFEHQALACDPSVGGNRNFHAGWAQYRSMVE